MLRLPPFRYLAPRDLAEAARALADLGPEAMLVAGGTDLFPNMKRRQFTPRTLIGLRAIAPLRAFRDGTGAGLRLGAGLTLTEVASHPRVRAAYPALAHAAGVVSTPQLRNMGTVGGNLCLDTRCNYYNQTYEWRQAIGFCLKKDGDICLVAPGSPRCWAISSSDTSPVLISLGARVRLLSVRGEREIPLHDLYRDDGIRYLAKADDEILTEILVPPAAGLRSTYWKLRRRGSFDFPILGVAAAVRIEGDVCTDARIVLTAVAPRPLVADAAQRLLVGQRLTPDLIEAAAELASGPAKPLDNTDLTHGYRKRMTRAFVARALREVAGLPPVPLAPDGAGDAAAGPTRSPAPGPQPPDSRLS